MKSIELHGGSGSKRRKKVVVVPCEVWSRIVGYYRPVSNWNEGKKQEFRERKHLKWG